MGVSELRVNLGSRIDVAHFRGEPTIVTSNGEPRAVLISYAEWLASQPDTRIGKHNNAPPSQNG